MNFSEIDAKVRASLNGLDISEEEKLERYPEILREMMKEEGFGYQSNNDNEYIKTVPVGHSITTNQDNFPYIHVWILNEDGTHTNHLFSPLEMQRSNTRASNSPEICFELRDLEG